MHRYTITIGNNTYSHDNLQELLEAVREDYGAGLINITEEYIDQEGYFCEKEFTVKINPLYEII